MLQFVINKLVSDETVWDFEFGIGIFQPKYRGIGIGFGIEIGIGIKLVSVLNLIQFVSCTCEYNVAIEAVIGMKSVSTDFGSIPNLRSVFKLKKKKHISFFYKSRFEIRYGLQIGSVSVYRTD